MSIVQNQIRTGYILLATVSDTTPEIYDGQGNPLFNLGDSYYNSLTCLIHTVIRDSEDTPMYWGSGSAPIEGHIYLNKALGIFYGVNNGELFANIGTVDLTNPMHVNLDMDSHKLLNVANGTNSGDAVNKGQLDLKANATDIIPNSEKGVADGVATLNSSGKIPSSQLELPIASTINTGVVKPDGITIMTTADGTLSATPQVTSYTPDLLDVKWSDHLLNNISWLRGDTFSWQSGSVYTAVYNHLVDDYNNTPSTITAPSGTIYVRDLYRDYYKDSTMTQYYAWYNSEASDYTTVYTTSVFPRIDVTSVYSRSGSTFTNLGKVTAANVFTEIIGDCSIECKVASDGHKICLADQETTAANIYAESGIAWYYILDTTNTRFKLPRTKYGFTGLRDTVGKYVEAGLPNITGDTGIGGSVIDSYSGAFYKTTKKFMYSGSTATEPNEISFDASLSSSIYGNSTTVQPPATQMYLYFYVGNFSQSATEQTAGLNSDLFNAKADINLSNVSNTSGFRRLIEISSPNILPSWYKVFAEYDPTTGEFVGKWCEQGGILGSAYDSYQQKTINLSKPFADINYYVNISQGYSGNSYAPVISAKTTTSFTAYNTMNKQSLSTWYACGYISQE